MASGFEWEEFVQWLPRFPSRTGARYGRAMGTASRRPSGEKASALPPPVVNPGGGR